MFLTNLVAIIFTAMVVFVALHINTEQVKERLREWQQTDRESSWVRHFFGKVPVVQRLRIAGSLAARFTAIVLTIALIPTYTIVSPPQTRDRPQATGQFTCSICVTADEETG